MENFDQPFAEGIAPGQDESLQITDEVRHYWRQTASWAMFFAVLLFIMFGLLTLFGLLLVVAGGAFGAFGGILAIAFYGVLFLLPGIYYYRFSTQMKQALATENATVLNESFSNLMRFYRFVGILMIVFLSVWMIFLLTYGAVSMRNGL